MREPFDNLLGNVLKFTRAVSALGIEVLALTVASIERTAEWSQTPEAGGQGRPGCSVAPPLRGSCPR